MTAQPCSQKIHSAFLGVAEVIDDFSLTLDFDKKNRPVGGILARTVTAAALGGFALLAATFHAGAFLGKLIPCVVTVLGSYLVNASNVRAAWIASMKEHVCAAGRAFAWGGEGLKLMAGCTSYPGEQRLAKLAASDLFRATPEPSWTAWTVIKGLSALGAVAGAAYVAYKLPGDFYCELRPDEGASCGWNWGSSSLEIL